MGKPTGLAKEQRRALGRLSGVAALRPFYLAGGTAIALHLHHRRSNDLDLFSEGEVDLGRVERALKRLPGVEVLGASDVTLQLAIDGALVDLVAYPYAPLEAPTEGPLGVRVASRIDLAVMKLSAVARRGLRRGFWDLRALIESGLSLDVITAAYVKRFRVSEGDLYPVLRSLTWFEDAEKDPAYPSGLTPRAWTATKRFFERRAGQALRSLAETD